MNFNQTYELYLVFAPTISESDLLLKIENISKNLEKELGALNLSVDNQGIHKTSYPIKKHWSGHYVSFTFEVELENLRKVNAYINKFNIDASILRYIITNETEFLKQKAKEKVSSSEIKNHRDLKN